MIDDDDDDDDDITNEAGPSIHPLVDNQFMKKKCLPFQAGEQKRQVENFFRQFANIYSNGKQVGQMIANFYRCYG